MSLESVLNQINSYKQFANENVEDGPAETLNGRRGRKNQAIEQLAVLKSMYRLDLLKSAVFIIVAGSQRKDFETIATGEGFKLFSADPDQFYSDLSGRIHPTLYLGKEGQQNLFDVLGRHLEDKMMELDANQYNQLIFKEKYLKPVKTQEEFTSIVKEAINEQIGAEIVGIQATTSILDEAINRNHSGKTTSILLSTSDEKLTQDLLKDLGIRGNRVMLVLAGKVSKSLNNFSSESINTFKVKEVTEENVKATIDSMKTLLKK
jgi:hypothetical protein